MPLKLEQKKNNNKIPPQIYLNLQPLQSNEGVLIH